MIDNLIFRCSSLPNIMGKTGLGKTGEKEALKAYAAQFLDRHKEIKSKYLEKGITNEQEAIEMVNRIRSYNYQKNEVRMHNEFITGECDLYDSSLKKVSDIKCSWDWFTFTDAIGDTSYEYQLRGYMELYNCEESEVIYCLTDMPFNMLKKQLEQMARPYEDMGIGLPDLLAIRHIKNHLFSQKAFNDFIECEWPMNLNDIAKEINKFVAISEKERIHIVNFKRNQTKTDLLYSRIKEARQFLKTQFN
jgi:hypothetical protein